MLDCVILAGGLGKRLLSVVADTPKPLANINGIPFLDLVLQQLTRFPEIRKVVLAVGYLKHQITERYRVHSYPYEIVFSEEDTPLGTGGAIQKAMIQTASSHVLVMNGDSYLQFDLAPFHKRHLETQADLTLLYREVPDVSRYGHLRLDPTTRRIVAFEEKTSRPLAGCINGGVYLIRASLLNTLSLGPTYSLETEGFPLLLKKRIFGYPCQGLFIDIGTPESFLEAQTLLQPLTVQQ